MTRYEPSLVVTRLIVLRSQHRAYDEIFHEGVNVIRGENSSGKSTILNCIYYGLGGDLADWSEMALLCTRVVVEARFNGLTATLSRDISSETGQPMEIFGGPYEASLKAPRPVSVSKIDQQREFLSSDLPVVGHSRGSK